MSDGAIATEPMLRKFDGSAFVAGPLIANALDGIAEKPRNENYLRGLCRDEFANRAAKVLVALNGVHPFREGNGRTQRVFIGELAKEAGHKLDCSTVTRERMIQASIAGNDKNDPSMMQRLFREISDPLRVAALSKTIDALEGQGFPWNNHYLATTEPGRKIDVHFAGVAGDQFMARKKRLFLSSAHHRNRPRQLSLQTHHEKAQEQTA